MNTPEKKKPSENHPWRKAFSVKNAINQKKNREYLNSKGKQNGQKIKSLIKDTKNVEKKEKKLLKLDKKNDKIIEKSKKMKKSSC